MTYDIRENEAMVILMDTLNQACFVCQEKGHNILDNHCISAYEDAFYFLEKHGYAKKIKNGRYKLIWN